MTLKEKITEILYKESHDDSECLRIRFENIDKVIDSQEKVAEEFAIGFAEWFWENNEVFYSGERDYYLEFNQILKIYKKEKGL
jgi:hypothetical protein